VKVGVHRSGKDLVLTIRAEPAPASPARDQRTLSGRNPFAGAEVVNLSPAVAEELGVDAFAGPGVLITKIGRGFAMNAGLQPGDMIRAVNGRKINSVSELVAATSAAASTWEVTIERGGQQITGRFRL
jgi:S1-C subfamily serine protease